MNTLLSKSNFNSFKVEAEEIETTKYKCNHCGKTYLRLSSMEKHKILCDLEHSNSYQNKVKSEEQEDMPTYSQLVELVKILHLKTISLEKKMATIQKINKANMNLLLSQSPNLPLSTKEYLNKNIIPYITFVDWVNQLTLNVDVEELIEKKFIPMVEQIGSLILHEERELSYPIRQDNKQIYIFTSDGWIDMSLDYLKVFCKKIQDLLIVNYTTWRNSNKDLLEYKDSLSIQYNKSILNILEFTNKYSSIKNIMLQHIQSVHVSI